ncbi:helix-turn-helix domain-containing protein [Candidatus Bathyarchaeota archaeon]|nr:helix-turn-helix domain-containing protein [Candidatus Bathyarchaeota archaeon]
MSAANAEEIAERVVERLKKEPLTLIVGEAPLIRSKQLCDELNLIASRIPELKALIILSRFEGGINISKIASECGIGRATFYRKFISGKPGKPPEFRGLVDVVDKKVMLSPKLATFKEFIRRFSKANNSELRR